MSASSIAAPSWTFSNESDRDVGERARCEIEFEVPYDLGPGVFMYYKLTNLCVALCSGLMVVTKITDDTCRAWTPISSRERPAQRENSRSLRSL